MMPELPEVEITCQQLRPVLVGKPLLKVKVFSDWARIPILFAEDLVEQTIQKIVRHGKNFFLLQLSVYFGYIWECQVLSGLLITRRKKPTNMIIMG